MFRNKDMWVVVMLVSVCGFAQGLSRVDPLVNTKPGLIRGLRSDDGYSMFLGVPYGLVDEKNPFGAAIDHPDFEDTFEAYNDSIACPHVHFGDARGTIQCLTMNIYVPDNANHENPLPVMVWIHGGAFIGGSAGEEASNPISLLRHDVIVVAINYRLGIYGFMCLDIPEVPGNQGLKDQIRALRWIKENIAAFGGDVSKITLFGESAGGMSSNLHLYSSYEKLFNNVIIESGPALSYWMMVESNTEIPFILAEEFGLNTTDINEALNHLSYVDPHSLVKAATALKITNAMGNDQPLTKPCVEKKFEGVENFMTEHPMNIRSTKASTTNIIIGHNNQEFAMQYAFQDAEYFEGYDIDMLFKMGFDMDNDLDEALDAVRHFYFGDEKISESVRWNLVDFGTDFIFGHPTQRMAEELLDSGAKSVYRYVFSYSGSRNMMNGGGGASHGDELAYLFDIKEAGVNTTTEDQLVIDRLTKLWTNFAKYGNPTPIASELPFQWDPITDTTQQYLSIDSDITLKSRPDHDRMAFWDIFYRVYGKYQKWHEVSKKEIKKLFKLLGKATESFLRKKISENVLRSAVLKKVNKHGHH